MRSQRMGCQLVRLKWQNQGYQGLTGWEGIPVDLMILN